MKTLKKTRSKIIKVKFGKNCQVVEPVNIYGCKIEDSEVILIDIVDYKKPKKRKRRTKKASASGIN